MFAWLRGVLLLSGCFLILPALGGNFFPPEYKSFPFKEGDLLVSQGQNGMFAVSKILKIDHIQIGKGKGINIQGKVFIAPEEDFLLVVSAAYGKREFASFAQAKTAALGDHWHVEIGHIPNRAPGAPQGQTWVGNKAVTDKELDGYKQWKAVFDKGEAGIF